MPPPPFVTCETTFERTFAFGIAVRSGPPLPPVPSVPWQTAQFAAKTDLPAAASPVLGLTFLPPPSPACSVPPDGPAGAAAGPSLPSSENSQRLSPCGVAISELPAERYARYSLPSC